MLPINVSGLLRFFGTFCLLSLFALTPLGGCSGDDDDDDDSSGHATPTPDGDDDATGDDDDATGDDDDATGDDDDATGDDDDDTSTLITTCPEVDLTPLSSGTCEVTEGDGRKLITGIVLTPGEVLRGGQVLVGEDGKLACVGCGCADQAQGATKVFCPTGVVSPGLINTHDHISFAQNDPYNDTGERYEQRHDWRKGKRGHTKISADNGASRDEVAWAELRFVLGGATATVSAGEARGFLRNLDSFDTVYQEGLGQDVAVSDTFPLGDNDGEQLTSGCDYPDIQEGDSLDEMDSYIPHVSEGIDDVAHNEYLCLSVDAEPAEDLVRDNSGFVHAVALTAPDYAAMAADGTSLIWSPRSNVTLYGDTAVITEAARFKLNIALGTDWMPTGSMNMLRELRCADDLNKVYYDNTLSDELLWLMVTRNAARALAIDDAVGILKQGLTADIAIFDGANRVNHRAVIEAEPKDVVLVLRGGKALYGDTSVISSLAGTSSCDTVVDPALFCGASKKICAKDDIGKTFAELKSSVGGIYPVAFCGEPSDEPSCMPERDAEWSVNGSTTYSGKVTDDDRDGDGIPNSSDNCSRIFNPVRPLDGGKQADFDLDGVGDACDPCPLDADTDDCTTFDPDDVDNDGKGNEQDNCRSVPNPDQADGDGDGHGDACDACPQDSNPGDAACPTSIYDIKDGTVGEGASVAVPDVLVTGRNDAGFFVQTVDGDPGYVGPEYSGIYVYAPANTVKAGDRVTIVKATVKDYYGQLQLDKATVVVDSSDDPLPAPVAIDDPAQIATGGDLTELLEAVLVRVSNVTVTALNPPVGPGDSDPNREFQVDGGLRVNDYLYLIDPFAVVGEEFASITGILELRNQDYKIEPRGAEDLVAGAPKLLSFSPEETYARVNELLEPRTTVPTPLTVSLVRAVETDTFVAIGTSDETSLEVEDGGVTIPAGEVSAEVLVTALLPSPAVTLTAVLDEVELPAEVEVLAADAQPALLSVVAGDNKVVFGESVSILVTLDLPAPVGGTEVTLALEPADLGTLPASVVIPEGAIDATVDFTAGEVAGDVVVTATLGDKSLETSFAVVRSRTDHLVINEVDYDNANTDYTEFVEIFNGTGDDVVLSDYVLVLINGSTNGEYDSEPRYELGEAGTLPAGGYLVLATDKVTVDPAAKKILFRKGQDNLQNGAPDGMALVRKSTGTVVDALSYEGTITSAKISGVSGTVNLVEGEVFAGADDSQSTSLSMIRFTNGTDTNNAATDWSMTTTMTPGAANVRAP